MIFSKLTMLAQAGSDTYLNVALVRELDQLWHWAVLLLICLLILFFIGLMYFKDSVELPAGLTCTLVVLRLCALFALLIFFLNFEKRSERKIVKNSRVVMLIDTSQSMGLRDSDSTSVPATTSRIEYVVNELVEGDLIENLRRHHDVLVYRFDELPKPVEVASFEKIKSQEQAAPSVIAFEQMASSRNSLIKYALGAGLLFVFSVVLGGLFLVLRLTPRVAAHSSWALLASTILLIGAFCILAFGSLVHSNASAVLIGFNTITLVEVNQKNNASSDSSDLKKQAEPLINWQAELLPHGTETRLGEALRFLIEKENSSTLAAILVFTDGGNNAGIDPQLAAVAAVSAEIPIYFVGLGANQRPTNLRVVDIEAPTKVYPGDNFTILGLLRSHGFEGRTVNVELVSFREENGNPTAETFVDQQRVKLAEDGQEVSVRFEVSPTENGRTIYKLRVKPPEQDHDSRDNEKSVPVEVVDRKNRVLLLAGGPTREYRFLRNQLYRDKNTTLDVLLQSGEPGMAQESDNLLFDFPQTADEMFQYDCVVAFDPDWQSLDDGQIELLDRWVAEKAGGLIVVAGPVHTPQWSNQRRNKRIDIIRGLYPVAFYNQGSATLRLGRFGGDKSWQLDFTRDGREVEFLRLGDKASDSELAWSEFDGVFGYYAVKDPKPGARIYAYFSDPETSIDNESPIYLAGHFYGAGRVFFQASGEMWRLRAVDETYFEQYYTKLIRWSSQGRLLRDSSRGILMVDKDRCLLGDHISVRAILTNAQHLPLTDEEVDAFIIQPDSRRVQLKLLRVKNGAREGMYASQFTVLQEGDYRIELKVTSGDDDELLRSEVRVRLPDLEIENPQRHDSLMTEIAKQTEGFYFIGIEQAMNRDGSGTVPVHKLVESREQTSYLPGTPDGFFQKLLMYWLLALACGALCMEWTTRRLSKLA